MMTPDYYRLVDKALAKGFASASAFMAAIGMSDFAIVQLVRPFEHPPCHRSL